MERKLASAQSSVSAAETTISDLNNSINELTQMGSDMVKQVFTFNHIVGEEGDTYKTGDGVIVMNVCGEANGIHEATHGYQMYKGTMSFDKNEREIPAYQRQYSFDPASVKNLLSSGGTVSSRSDINFLFVLGINFTDKDGNIHYPYASAGLSQKQILQMIHNAKK